ncbi:MAG: type IV pilus secretin PilQ [Acidobacteriota bacterium]
MSKRPAPSLAMAVTLTLLVSGLAFATRGKKTEIPDVITVSRMTASTGEGFTEIILQGNFPINYLLYQPERGKLIVEVQDCDASQVQVPSVEGSHEVLSIEASTAREETGPLSRFTFSLAPQVNHSISPVGNDLVMRFLDAAAPAAGAEREDKGAPVPQDPAPKPRPAATAGTPATPPPPAHLINYRQTDATTFADAAGLPSDSRARALLGVDTARSDRGEVTLLLDGAASYSSFELENPTRLVIDFEGLRNEVLRRRIPVDSSYVRRVRVSQFREKPQPVARAVFDTTGSVDYQIVPAAEGLDINFSRATVPTEMNLEMASASSTPEPAAVETVSEEPDPGIPALADSAANDPEEAGSDPQVAPEEDTVQDYAFYSEAQAAGTPAGSVRQGAGLVFESRTLSEEGPSYTGRRISLELVDADIKQVFRLFHEISGLNFVLDPSVNGKVTIVLDNVPWDQSLDIILRNNGLDKVFENNVVRIATTAKLASEAQQRRALKDAARLEVDPVTVSRVLSYAKAEDVDQIVRRMLTSGSSSGSSQFQSYFDKRTNTIIFTTIPDQAEAVNKLLDELDARTPQVMIEARIVETSREFTRDLGIQWGFTANDQRGAGNNFNAQFDLNLPRVADTSRLGISFGDLGPNGFAIDLALDALETEGRGRILSAPKVAAQNNTTAVIEQGVQIPVVNTTATEINVEFISASLKLEVTPQITAEGTIIMDINVDNSSPDFKNLVGDTPAINTERASTRVLVEDGGTTVIGGVFLMNEGESEVGIPGLRKIPGLGWLFKNKNITKQNRELLIFITPKISR